MAKKLGLVHCRVCKKNIDRNIETGWIMPSRNYFYHEACYKEWVEKKDDLHARAADNECLSSSHVSSSRTVGFTPKRGASFSIGRPDSTT